MRKVLQKLIQKVIHTLSLLATATLHENIVHVVNECETMGVVVAVTKLYMQYMQCQNCLQVREGTY